MTHTILDTRGLICPEPIMLLHKAMRRLEHDDTVEMLATDPAASRDVRAFCQNLGHLLEDERELPSDDAGARVWCLRIRVVRAS